MINIYKDITLILVTYRSEKLIIKNMEMLKKFPVVIIDNSNSDELEKIIFDYRNINLIKSSKNLGYGAANNLAVSKASTPFILIINPDILINEDSISDLFKNFLNDPDNIGILGPSLYDQKMYRRTNGSISYLDQLNGVNVSNLSNNIPSYNTCCKFLMGCCYLMRRDFFNSLGGFDENFFMYFEDNDLCDRTLKKGKYIMEVPSSKFIHLENASSKKNFLTDTKLSIIHKISSYIYLKKNNNVRFLIFHIIKNFIDYFQRFIVNLIIFKPIKSFKNFLRLVSIILYITLLYKVIYRIWNI
jgi:GT2 family glycosyltransferase